MLRAQAVFQEMVGDLELSEQERVRRVGQLQLLSLGQATHMMEELGYQTHLPFHNPNWDNALHEWVDQFKYLLAQAVVAGWEAEDIERVFLHKTLIVQDRYARQLEAVASRPVVVFDLDGVIAHYSHEMTDEEMANGALLHASVISSTVELLHELRDREIAVVIITSRKIHQWRRIELDTERWLTNYEVPYDQLIFAYDKHSAVAELNVLFAVEDSQKHALDFANAGVPTFFVQSTDPDSVPPEHGKVYCLRAEQLGEAVFRFLDERVYDHIEGRIFTE